ncbi:hypothetical protein [Chromatium okenii]|jgi:uncharacterized protein YdeI (BOF family)|uniref:hypothetical protein n=1 Tax=Chromatium okenii TaxID=61644 RepID=UPI0026EBDF5F|nr:hypothetical protein [Chromatium okenii]MBV5310450.1 hypothetical protein [Chromatium okenii]
MARLTIDQWAALRLEWEGDQLASFHALAQKHGVDKANISRKAAKEGWSKTGQIRSINEHAQRLADAKVNAEGNVAQRERTSDDLATRDESAVLRAAVNVRMRQEWAELEGFRKTALKAMKDAHDSGDKGAWAIAKTAADTALANIRSLAVKQDGERKAWGLDVNSEEDIVIMNPRKMSF